MNTPEITYISNSEFCHLNNDEREKLKTSYKNYITDLSGNHSYYIQDVHPWYFEQHLNEILTKERAMGSAHIYIYINDQYGREHNLFRSVHSEELF